jgi:hypothetical protein
VAQLSMLVYRLASRTRRSREDAKYAKVAQALILRKYFCVRAGTATAGWV